jgi:hypothetical protein
MDLLSKFLILDVETGFNSGAIILVSHTVFFVLERRGADTTDAVETGILATGQ